MTHGFFFKALLEISRPFYKNRKNLEILGNNRKYPKNLQNFKRYKLKYFISCTEFPCFSASGR